MRPFWVETCTAWFKLRKFNYKLDWKHFQTTSSHGFKKRNLCKVTVGVKFTKFVISLQYANLYILKWMLVSVRIWEQCLSMYFLLNAPIMQYICSGNSFFGYNTHTIKPSKPTHSWEYYGVESDEKLGYINVDHF